MTTPNNGETSEQDDNFSEDDIATVAQQIWEQEGRPEGKAEEHWQRAKEHLKTHSSRGAGDGQT